MMLLKGILFHLALIFQLSVSQLVVKLGANKAFSFSKFMLGCPNKIMPTRYENITFLRVSGQKFYFDYDFVVDRDVELKTLFFRFQKCPSSESLDHCSTLPTFKTTNFCALMVSEHDVWSPIMTCSTPRIPCPYKKGIYRGRNCSVDMEAFKFFPLGTGSWRLQSDIEDDKQQTVFCLVNEGNVARL